VSHELSVLPRRGVLATKEERAVARRIGALQGKAIERRAEDALRRELASGRIKDIRSLTKDALEAGGEIADVLVEEVQARPFFGRELADIASTGARGLKSELRGYVEGD
jgi:hypothetical protein